MSCIKSQIEHLTKIADFNKPSSCDSLFYGKWGKWWRFAVQEQGETDGFVGDLFETEHAIKMSAFDYANEIWGISPDRIPQKYKLAKSGLNITQEEIGAIQTAKDNLKHSLSETDQMTWFYLDSLLSKLTK